jgi:hypothetical protein
LSIDVPAEFGDAPLAPHHRLMGRWVASRASSSDLYTRADARRLIEQTFKAAVMEILRPVSIVNLRVVVFHGDDNALPPALSIICDEVGQIDLGWIEKNNVLSTTLFERIAPIGWQAAAYQALVSALCYTLPVFGYDDLFEEMSMYYWEGETEDEGARAALVEWHGADLDDIPEDMLPSAIHARRPAWMLPANAAPLKDMPKALAQRIRRLRAALAALQASGPDGSAWRFDTDLLYAYRPDTYDGSHLPPLTLVPYDPFARELDDVARSGMETSFLDTAGLSPLSDAGTIDQWFDSLRLGAEVLIAAQNLINIAPGDE